jgi:hypothetical protein
MNAKWDEWVLAYGPDNQTRFMEWLGMDKPDWQKMMLTLLACVIAGIAMVSLILIRRNLPPPRDPAAVLYGKFTRKAGLAPRTGETPYDYARRLCERGMERSDSVDRITLHYLTARYGTPADGSLRELKAAVAGFRKSA